MVLALLQVLACANMTDYLAAGVLSYDFGHVCWCWLMPIQQTKPDG